MTAGKIVVASNRLPIVLKTSVERGLSVAPGSGGLVTALAPVLRDRGGLWIGWPGGVYVEPDELQPLLVGHAPAVGYDLWPIPLTDLEVKKFYHGFANEIIWPLFHDLPSRCNFDPTCWPVYRAVNRRFAEAIAAQAGEQDYVWVQDYHLMLVAEELSRLRARRRSGYFLHIPFPAVDLFLKMPWRHEMLQALLHYDLVGFQTQRDRRNFLNCIKTLVSNASISGGRQVSVVRLPDREVRVGVFPISIDFEEFAELASAPETQAHAARLRAEFGDVPLILGVDRLDYSKGIPERIQAVGQLLERRPELLGRFVFVQVVVPSRTDVQQYKWLKRDIERLVGETNGRFSRAGWAPIHYVFRVVPRPELVAYYRAAEIALITPLKDGMNLVAKEFCAADVDLNGVLILSESAGAAAQLHANALLVNPHDVIGIGEAIDRALAMPPDERAARMRRMRAFLRTNTVHQWVDSFLRAAFARRLDDFPVVRYYPQVPRMPVASPSNGRRAAGA